MYFPKTILFSLLFCVSTLQAQHLHSLSLCGKEPLTHLPDDAVLLYDHWQMRESALCGNTGELFSTRSYGASDWYGTTAPVTALGVLVNHGVYPNPYIGLNNMQIPDASDEYNEKYGLAPYSHLSNGENPWSKPYWFRNVFDVPESYRTKTVWLNFDGINYRADIWLNGKKIAEKDTIAGMFRRFRLDVSDNVVVGGKNVLAVCIYPLDHPGNPVHAQIDGLSGALGPNAGDAEITRDVTMYCTVGWDWMPSVPDRNIGIWRHVWLSATGAVRVSDPAVFTQLDLPDLKKAEAKIRLYLKNASSKTQKASIEAQIFPDGFAGETIKIAQQVTIKANERKEIIFDPKDFPELILKNPKIWWPNTYGDQPLYKVKIQALLGGKVSSEETRRFGVRQFGSYLLESQGRAFEVNGVTIRMSGGAWIPDMMLTWDAQRYRDEVHLMAAGNATFVRINGCGMIPPDVFFDACDEYGLLVWQDLMRTTVSPDYRKDPNPGSGYFWHPCAVDSALYMDNMIDNIERIRGYASMYIYCGANEAAPQKNTGVALQNDIIPAMDGTRLFIASSHEQPEWSHIKIGTYTGGPWEMRRLPEYYSMYKTAATFESRNEIGLASVPPINSLAKFEPDLYAAQGSKFPLNKSMGYHDATGFAMQALDKIMREDLGNPSNITEYLWWGDLYNNTAYRAIFEAANAARPRNAGTTLWKTNAAWGSFNWQLYDHYLRPNAGYYSSRSALKPVHIQLDVEDLEVQLINALPVKLENYRATVEVLTPDGKTEKTFEQQASAAENANAKLMKLSEWLNDGDLHFVLMYLYNSQGALVDKTVTWYQRDMQWSALTKMSLASLAVQVVSISEENGENIYRFQVTNQSAVPAVHVMLELIQGYQGQEILPSFWTDNALTLLPRESSEISVRVRASSVLKSPHLMVEGLNVAPGEWDLATQNRIPLSLDVQHVEQTVKDGRKHLAYSVASTDLAGERINSWPLKVSLDGQLLRYLMIGCKAGGESAGWIDIDDWKSGKYQVEMGKITQEIVIK
ncbi:MAG: hypothetical protein LBM08_11165 [Dysgonamonadaceae bacterium]|jgi:beta-galactosidase/beta-glucuronidase|nr:hypothetical protein [Dysgonamonadaceae bacterium]